MEQTKTVRVSYVPKGFGLALEIDDTGELRFDGDSGSGNESDGEGDGVLRVSDARITVELPAVDGKVSTLAWDPAEVSWDSLIAS